MNSTRPNAPHAGTTPPPDPKRLRLAAMLAHPTARRALSPPPDPLFEPLGPSPWSPPVSWPDVIAAGLALAEGLAEAHRLGLHHGRLAPDGVATDPRDPALPKLDWTRTPATPPDRPADVRDLGRLLAAWLAQAGPAPSDARLALVEAALCAVRLEDPDARPTAAQLAARLSRALADLDNASDPSLGASGVGWPGFVPAPMESPPPQLGRFVLREPLGAGGMGAVYRAEDLADGSTVAIKVLRGEWSRRPEALRRLAREARFLREVNNPHITNLLEMNEDGGVHYLVLEYVRGTSLATLLDRSGPLDEPTALRIMAAAARGLAVAHARGIVHRDVKPANILILDPAPDADPSEPPRVKFADFGLARSVIPSGPSAEQTQLGAIVGTPAYMAPEQGGGDEVGPAADVYALGATLFHALAGRPPFASGTILALIARHRDEPPPRLDALVPGLAPSTCRLVARALEKRPENRQPDAAAFLSDLERTLRGEPIEAAPPEHGRPALVSFQLRLDLECPPESLWPHLANVDRIAHALGCPAVEDAPEPAPRRGFITLMGLRTPISDAPSDWVKGRRLLGSRSFARGPFRRIAFQVELDPRAGGGTALTQHVEFEPAGLPGRLAARWLASRARRALERLVRRVDAAVALASRHGGEPLTGPIEPPAALARATAGRVDRWLVALGQAGFDPRVIERLGDFFTLASPPDLARVRPLALARRLGLDPARVVEACLHGALDGLLERRWQVACSWCHARLPSADPNAEFTCPTCLLRQTPDPVDGPEMVFHPSPSLRMADPRIFAFDPPTSFPHVIAQARLAPGERRAWIFALAEGEHLLRGLGPRISSRLRVDESASARRIDLDASRLGASDLPDLRPGPVVIAWHNDATSPQVVRLERPAPDPDRLTPATASASPFFRERFPDEVLPAGQPRRLADVTLLVTEAVDPSALYRDLGDARAFALLHAHFLEAESCARRHGGAAPKALQSGILAPFDDPASAVRAALDLARSAPFPLRVAVHRGPALLATLDGRPEHHGVTVSATNALARQGPPGSILITPPVARDPWVGPFLDDPAQRAEILPAHLPGMPERFAYRLPADTS